MPGLSLSWTVCMMIHMSLQIGSQRDHNEHLATAEEMPLHLGRPVKVLNALYPAANHDRFPRALWALSLVYGVSILAAVWVWPAFRVQL